MTRTQIQLPDDLYRRAKALAADREISLAELVRNGLEYMLSALTPPNAEAEMISIGADVLYAAVNAVAVVKQAEFDFVKDVKGREWDYCVLVTNDEKTRWYVVLRCAFRKLLMPERPLGAVIPIQ